MHGAPPIRERTPPDARLLRLVRAARRRRGDGRHAARPHAGPRPDHRAAPRRSPARPGRLRAAEFWATILGSLARSAIGHSIDRFGSRVVLTIVAVALGLVVCAMSRTSDVRRARCLADADARARPERAVGREPRDCRALVRAADRHGHGGLQHRHEHRLHDRVSRRGLARAAAGVARRVAGDRVRAHRCARAAGVGRRSSQSGGDRAWRRTGSSSAQRAVRIDAATAAALTGYPWRAAIATPAFWVFAIGAALYGLVASGIGLFNESILARARLRCRTCTTRRWSSPRLPRWRGTSSAAGSRGACR